MDSYGKKAGKGALLSENLSMTLGVSQDQYLFQPIVIDPVGGQAERAWQTDVSPTLKATHYKFPPTIRRGNGDGKTASTLTGDHENRITDYTNVLAIGIDRAAFNQGENAKYDFAITEDVMPTIVARGPNAVCCKTFAMQGFGDYKESDKASGLKARDYKDSTDLCVLQIQEADDNG